MTRKQRNRRKSPTTTSPATVIPGITTSVPSVSVGDTVQILPGRLSAGTNVLYSGAKARVVSVKREFGMTLCLLRLTKRNSAGVRVQLWKPAMELFVLNPGEWRQPAKFDPRPEHATVYNTIWG